MKNLLTTIEDFTLNIIGTGLQWITIIVMFPFKLLNKAWIGTVHFLGTCLIGIADAWDFIVKAIQTIIKTILIVLAICLALAIILILIPCLIWLIGGTVFGIGWLLMLAGTFMMAHLIATGIIVLLIIIIFVLLVILSGPGVLNGC